MTEHFTQAGMKELAGEIGISFYPRYFSDKNLTDLCNAAVNHKLKEWGAQEPVAYLVEDSNGDGKAIRAKDISKESLNRLIAVTVTKLYAAPVAPAQDVNAEIEHWKALYENSTAAHEETVGRAMKAEKELASIKAQEPVAKAVSLTTGVGLQWVGDPLPAGTALYTRALPAQPAQGVNAELVGAVKDALEKPAYSHALALGNITEALDLVLRWVDDWCETGPETGFEAIESKANYALANAKAAPVQGMPSTINCPEKLKPGGCQLHNLHCAWPKCNEAAPQQEQKGGE